MKLLILLFAFVFPSSSNEDIPLKQKISQFIIATVDIGEIEKAKKLIAENIGGIQLQWGNFSLEETQNFTYSILDSSFSVYPFIAMDYEGGSVYHSESLGLLDLPTNMMIGAANDPNNSASLFYLAGLELKKAGINMSFSPVVDVNTNPMNPIIGIRSFSSNPEKVFNMANAAINGFKAANIISTLKHFPGHGDTNLDSHKTLPVLDLEEDELYNTHIYPFKKIIEQKNADCIMTAHVIYSKIDDKLPASLSSKVMKNILRENLKYDGLIITDSLDMKAITSKYRIEEASLIAFKNGADLLLIGRGDFYKVRDRIYSEVLKGNIDINRINNSYKRITEIKSKYKLNMVKSKDEFSKAYNTITRELSAKAITLYKNNDKLVPLDKGYKNISLIFFMPERFYSDSINLYKRLILYGFKARQYNFSINPTNEDNEKIEKIIAKSNIVIVGSFQWSGVQNNNQRKTIEKILSSGKKTILISLMSPYDIKNFPQAKNIIMTYGITSFTMDSLADLLDGNIKSQGILPVNLNFD
jgi:beta-N-acetylhexosaminidase